MKKKNSHIPHSRTEGWLQASFSDTFVASRCLATNGAPSLGFKWGCFFRTGEEVLSSIEEYALPSRLPHPLLRYERMSKTIGREVQA